MEADDKEKGLFKCPECKSSRVLQRGLEITQENGMERTSIDLKCEKCNKEFKYTEWKGHKRMNVVTADCNKCRNKIAIIPNGSTVRIESFLFWTEGRPTVPGFYLVKRRGQWPVYQGSVHYGKWQYTQNPEWLYFNDRPISGPNAEQGESYPIEYYYGPIPPYPGAEGSGTLDMFGVAKEKKEGE